MTVSKLRTELSDAELMYFAAYYELKNKREEQRKSQGELKKYINYALQRPDPENKPLTMFEQTNQGTIIIDGETEIKNK